MKQYAYTIYKQDGTIKRYPPCKKKTFEDFYRMLNCQTIEIIPPDYYKGMKWGHCTVYGDEEARFNNQNTKNPHFKVLADGYDVVGDIIKEEVYHEKS